MSTRGMLYMKHQGCVRGVYNHYDSYYKGGVGEWLVDFLRKKTKDELVQMFWNLLPLPLEDDYESPYWDAGVCLLEEMSTPIRAEFDYGYEKTGYVEYYINLDFDLLLMENYEWKVEMRLFDLPSHEELLRLEEVCQEQSEETADFVEVKLW